MLLNAAQSSLDGQQIASIQARLSQATPGQMCPRKLPEEGEVLAQKTNWLKEQFIVHRRSGDSAEMAGQVFALMRE